MRQDFHAYTMRYNGLSLAIITEIKVTQAFEPSESILPPSNVFSGKALLFDKLDGLEKDE